MPLGVGTTTLGLPPAASPVLSLVSAASVSLFFFLFFLLFTFISSKDSVVCDTTSIPSPLSLLQSLVSTLFSTTSVDCISSKVSEFVFLRLVRLFFRVFGAGASLSQFVSAASASASLLLFVAQTTYSAASFCFPESIFFFFIILIHGTGVYF